MTYEIILTDSCNRKCPFCYIQQNGYVESLENVGKFIANVMDFQRGKEDKFDVNMFGGEPFLNFSAIETICAAFLEDKRCNVNVITNGDLIEDWMVDRVGGCNLNLSTYDIFDPESHDRYVGLCSKFKKSVCLYTMTEDDIGRFFELRGIYESLGLDYHVHLSHSPSSWVGLGSDALYGKVKIISDRLCSEYLDSFSNSSPRAPNFIEQHLIRYLNGAIRGHGDISSPELDEFYCTSHEKKVFYRGEFVGPCIRLRNTQLKFRGEPCSACTYRKVCTKGCFAEISGCVNPKLCTIERAMFDCISEMLNGGHKNIPRIMHFYRNRILYNNNYGR